MHKPYTFDAQTMHTIGTVPTEFVHPLLRDG